MIYSSFNLYLTDYTNLCSNRQYTQYVRNAVLARKDVFTSMFAKSIS